MLMNKYGIHQCVFHSKMMCRWQLGYYSYFILIVVVIVFFFLIIPHYWKWFHVCGADGDAMNDGCRQQPNSGTCLGILKIRRYLHVRAQVCFPQGNLIVRFVFKRGSLTAKGEKNEENPVLLSIILLFLLLIWGMSTHWKPETVPEFRSFLIYQFEHSVSFLKSAIWGLGEWHSE